MAGGKAAQGRYGVDRYTQVAYLEDTNRTNGENWHNYLQNLRVHCQKNKGLFCSARLMYETLQAVWQDMSHLGWSQTKSACQVAVFECWRKIVKFAIGE